MNDSRLKLTHEKPKQLNPALRETEGLRDLMAYYQVEAVAFQEDAVDTVVDRVRHYFISQEEELSHELVAALLTGDLPATSPERQKLLNIQQAIQYLGQMESKPFSLPMLQQVHKLLMNKMASPHTPGVWRTQENSLFSAVRASAALPGHDTLMDYLQYAVSIANDKQQSILIRCGLVFYLLMVLKPFLDENETVAMLVCSHLLQREGYGLAGMLNLEKYLFFHKKYELETAELFGEMPFEAALSADLTSFLDTCIHCYRDNMQAARKRITEEVKKLMGYHNLVPRQKNNLNFWLEKGFYMHRKKLPELSDRQQEIMLLLARYGSLANKELVPVFRVDRKTIQRDFNELLEKGLVEIRGAGRNFRYHLDFRVHIG